MHIPLMFSLSKKHQNYISLHLNFQICKNTIKIKLYIKHVIMKKMVMPSIDIVCGSISFFKYLYDIGTY